MFYWFSVIFFVTMNLVTLDSFLFIHSFKATHPKSLGCRQSFPSTSVDLCHSHFPNVATAIRTKLPTNPFELWAAHTAHGRGQLSLQDGCQSHRDKTTKWFLHTRVFLLHCFDSWAIWYISNKPQFAHLFRTEEITLQQGTINYAETSEMMKRVHNFSIDIWALYKCKEYFCY